MGRISFIKNNWFSSYISKGEKEITLRATFSCKVLISSLLLTEMTVLPDVNKLEGVDA